MSQAEVADALGITRQSVRDAELRALRKLAELIRTEPDLQVLAEMFEEAAR